jgi:hypothetical protein
MTENQKAEKESFDQIAAGEERELRLADSGVHEGDTLILEEWDPDTQAYTGRKIETLVTAVRKTTGGADQPPGEGEEGLLLIQFEPKESKYTPSS